MCVGVWVLFFYLGFGVYRNPDLAMHAVLEWISGLTSLTHDPVLNFLIGAVLVIVGLCLSIGVIVVGLWLLVGGMALGVLATILAGLASLSQVSTTGAIVALLVVGTALFFLLRWIGRRIKPFLLRAAEPLFGIFFEWWIQPLWLRRKGRRLMGKIEASKEALAVGYQKLQLQHPEIASVPLANTYDGWLSQAYQRFQTRQLGKTFAEQGKAVEQQKNLFERVKQLYTEFAAAADAYDDVKHLENRLQEKREEEEIRRYDRKKRLLSLKKEIKDLKVSSKPVPQPPKSDPVEEEVNRVTHRLETDAALQRAEEDMVRKHPGQEAEIRRTFRKRREELREAW
jgi:hypothetical protein